MTTLSWAVDKKRYKIAMGLAIFTIGYNIAEGVLATFLGAEDESLALFGFGVDSFIEVISGLGIAHMILRIQRQPNSSRDAFERRALRITGFAFYILVVGLVVTSMYNIWAGHQPITTIFGVVIALVSIVVMWLLVAWKRKIGHKLNSQPIIADAQCTMVCVYMSVILLISSGIYELTAIPYMDSVGTLGLAFFAFREGRECFEKARGNGCGSCK
jgi:divalent metal cation (Fe/Co/Zn/Cd) transporter